MKVQKKPLLFRIAVLFLFFNFTEQSVAQILPDPVFSYLPCSLSPGNTDSATVIPVPGATGYIWSVDSTTINGMLFNGGLSPQQTQGPLMNITAVLPQLYYLICVTAVSPCCTSATVCDTVWSYPQYVFDSTNSVIASPNTSSTYSIHPLCLPPGNNMIIFWNVTGGIGINGTGDSSITTGSSFPFVELNFGPGFTTGELCFYTVSNFGIPSDTMCMTINAPTSVSDPDVSDPDIFYSAQDHSVFIFMNGQTANRFKYEIIDITGKIHATEEIQLQYSNNSYQIPVNKLSEDIYLIRLTSANYIKTQKVLVTH